jgi:hypothetical protein
MSTLILGLAYHSVRFLPNPEREFMLNPAIRAARVRFVSMAAAALICMGCSTPTEPVGSETAPSLSGGMITIGGGGVPTDTTSVPAAQPGGADAADPASAGGA